MTKMRANLVKNLKQNVVKVNFTKVNGEERTMNCTLHESVLPVATMSQKERKENKEVLEHLFVLNCGKYRKNECTDYGL